ncbi:hypothetical protein ACH4KU_13725 [Streptomyces althioticus]|uniref:hypothetical protein n=1 Tax=Streptomyces althioticus TaxID=83380 RepID=UPI0037B2698C
MRLAGMMIGAGILAGAGLAQPAVAADGEPDWSVSSFYTQPDFKGAELQVDLSLNGCQELSEPANSVINMNASRKGIVYYYEAGCQGTGIHLDDLRTVTRSTSPIVSYRVVELD